MKTVKWIVGVWIVIMLSGIFIVSCEKEDEDVIVGGYKMAKGVSIQSTSDAIYTQPNVKKMLEDFRQNESIHTGTQLSESISLDTMCGLLMGHNTRTTYFNNMMQREESVNLVLTPCAGAPLVVTDIPVAAISIVVNYDPTKCIPYPVDLNKVNPDLLNALSQGAGILVANVSNGKIYFAWCCIVPVTIDVLQGDLFSMDFNSVTPGAILSFDTLIQGNLSVSQTGWDELNLIVGQWHM